MTDRVENNAPKSSRDTLDDKLAREASLFASLPEKFVEGFVNEASTAWDNKGKTATEMGLAAAAGTAYSLLSRNPSDLVRSRVALAGKVLLTLGMLDLGRRVAVPAYATWTDPNSLEQSKVDLGNNLGTFAFDVGISAGPGLLATKYGARALQGTRVAEVLSGYRTNINPHGDKFYRYSNGEMKVVFPDHSESLFAKDGTVITRMASGARRYTYSDGIQRQVEPDGTQLIRFPKADDGLAIHIDSGVSPYSGRLPMTRFELRHPDGAITRVRPDWHTEIRKGEEFEHWPSGIPHNYGLRPFSRPIEEMELLHFNRKGGYGVVLDSSGAVFHYPNHTTLRRFNDGSGNIETQSGASFWWDRDKIQFARDGVKIDPRQGKVRENGVHEVHQDGTASDTITTNGIHAVRFDHSANGEIRETIGTIGDYERNSFRRAIDGVGRVVFNDTTKAGWASYLTQQASEVPADLMTDMGLGIPVKSGVNTGAQLLPDPAKLAPAQPGQPNDATSDDGTR